MLPDNCLDLHPSQYMCGINFSCELENLFHYAANNLINFRVENDFPSFNTIIH